MRESATNLYVRPGALIFGLASKLGVYNHQTQGSNNVKSWVANCIRPGVATCYSFFWAQVLAFLASAAVTSGADLSLFPVTTFTLTNGLQVLTLEDHNAPLAAVQVWYHVGSADEPAGRHGFAHLFEHMMFRGTDRLGPTDHFDLLHVAGQTVPRITGMARRSDDE